MKHSSRRRVKPAGAAPGTVVYIGEARSEPVHISHIQYDSQAASAPKTVAASEVRRPSDVSGVSWFTIDGVHDTAALQVIGDNYSLHPLVLEDIANTRQRPKIEDFDNYIFIAMKMITYNAEVRKLRAEHVSIIFGKGYVLAFLEDEGDVFEPVRQRVNAGKGRIRKLGADYLAYALMDAVVDNYFTVLESLGEEIEALEEEVVQSPSSSTLAHVHRLKRELIFLRRAVWPMRETVNSLLRDESDLVTAETRVFLRDLYDHTVHVIDTVETLRDIVGGMLEVYLSSVSNKLNQVMKVLTVMSSIFIPLTFVVGVYGMNFQYMPELQWHYGYPVVMGGLAIVAVVLLVIFKRRDWL
jgi:magnesium transporter